MKYLFTIFERYQYIKFCYLINVSSYTTRFILWQCTICTRSINLVQQVSDIISKCWTPFNMGISVYHWPVELTCIVLVISVDIISTLQQNRAKHLKGSFEIISLTCWTRFIDLVHIVHCHNINRVHNLIKAHTNDDLPR
jgi:hypothetical protein